MFRRLHGLLMGSILAIAATTAWAAPDVNQASQAELESLKGVGPGTSAKILEERKKSPFKDWNDLIERVKGVGAGSAAKLSAAGLTVNGAAYTAPASAEAPKKSEKKAADKVAAPAAAPTAAAPK